ncbi:MAG: alpha-galactosidase, partial [Candidatus Hydrogenedentes bacterium]|nr:alpha-galactosidase [Candidatus Hydrogenedentota bacterium]
MSVVKIALIGAGSRSFGPSSIKDVLLSEPLAEQGVELVLMDTVAAHLKDSEQYARRVAEKLNRRTSITATTDLDAALRGTRFVVTAIEVDRFLYWSQDYHVPRKHGFRQVFGENGGPGGLFHALRNMTPMLHIAKTMERLCPDAWLMNFTNPEHKLCEAISRLTSIRNVGLCHGVFMGMEQIARILDMPVEHLDGAACGMNHFTFFQTIRDRRTGEDLYPRLRALEREGDWLHDWHEIAMARILFRRFGLWPSPAANHYGEYIRWAEEFVASECQYFYDPADGHPWQTGNVPEFVYSLSGNVTGRPWKKPEPEPASFETSNLLHSGELAVPIMEGIACGVRRRLEAVNVPNRGAIPNLPDDMVVEIPATVDASGMASESMPPLPEPLAAMMRTQATIHQLLVEAFAE